MMTRYCLHRIISLAALCFVILSCDYRDIKDDWYESTELCVETDWTGFPEEPTGMTVIFYPRDINRNLIRVSTNDVGKVYIYLPVGVYDAIIFNQSETEFGTLEFQGMDHFDTAEARALTRELTWDASTDGQNVASEPEWLGVAVLTGFEVTHAMVDATHYINEYEKSGGSAEKLEEAVRLTTVNVQPRNVVYSARIDIRVKGVKNIRTIRGTMTGLASGYLMGQKCSSSEKSAYALELWSLTKDEDDPTMGITTSVFRTFGLPGVSTKSQAADANKVYVSYLLVDNTTRCDFSFKVGDRVEQIDETLSLNVDIGVNSDYPQSAGGESDPDRPCELPDVESAGGGAGFDVTVTDWGDTEEVDVPLT